MHGFLQVLVRVSVALAVLIVAWVTRPQEPTVRPMARPVAVAPIQRTRSAGSIPPMPAWTAPSATPPVE